MPYEIKWWRNAEQQLNRARQLWPGLPLPMPPSEFTPRTTTEVPLLHVPDGFDSLWKNVAAPQGYAKERPGEIGVDERSIRLAPNKRTFTRPIWLAFDPEHGRGVRPDSLWGQDNLAASEVLSALIQFPDWPLYWNKGVNGAAAPNLSGYQLGRDDTWSRVPFLYRWTSVRALALGSCWAGTVNVNWASPTVREYL